jgi:methyl-accepting chemotaxis protein
MHIKSIKTKIVLSFGLLFLAGSLLLTVTAVFSSREAVGNEVAEALELLAVEGSKLVASRIEIYYQFLEGLAGRSHIANPDTTLTDKLLFLNDIKNSRNDFIRLGIAKPDGFVHFTDTHLTDPIGTDVRSRQYFVDGLAGKRGILLPTVSINPADNGGLVMVMSTPIYDENRIIGVLVAIMDGNFLNTLTDDMGFGDNGYAYITTQEGTVIAHPVRDHVINQFNPMIEVNNNPILQSFADSFKVITTQRRGITAYHIGGLDFFTGFSIVDGFGWRVVLASNQQEVLQGVTDLQLRIIIVSSSILLVIILFSYVIGNTITKPINIMKEALENISQGEGDLTQKIFLKTKDEIGEMAYYFNLTFDKIRNLVALVKHQSSLLQSVGENLSSNMTETAAAINEISANILSIKNQTVNQSASVTETSATMEQITKSIATLNTLIEEQSANVTESSSAIEQMMANIGSVTQTLIKNSDNIHNLTNSSEAGRNGLDSITQDILQVAKESEGLLEISQVIQDIASQTNLLSMNAAIEAAHAGDSGKGFAVVADEIRKLAENSGQQAQTVSSVLKRIKDAIEGITSSSTEVLNRFEIILTEVKNVAEQETGIRHAMEEQSTGSKQVLDAISILNEITLKIQSNSQEVFTGSRQVSQEAMNMNTITQEITNGMNEMATGAEQVTVAVDKVNELTAENNISLEALLKEVGKFKVD